LKLNAEFNPNSTQIPFLLGETYLQKGDTATALTDYREALAKDSTNVAARRRIAALGGAPHQ
jgi:Tfp pilus assembly protein PilF